METDPPPSGFSQPYSLDTNSHAQVYQHDLLGDYKRLIVKLGDALNDDESKGKIRYLHKDKLGGACGEDTKASALDLLKKLEEKGLFSARNISPLESLLKDVDRCDLIESHLEPYRRKYAHQLSQAASLQHSFSSPDTSSFPSRPQSASLNRSTSFPIATETSTTMRSHELCSIEEEHQMLAVEDPTNPAHGTHVSQKSLLVSGTFKSEILPTLKMSGIGGMSPYPPNSHSSEGNGLQCTELNSSPRYPLRQATCSLRQGHELTSMKQANGASNSSVQVSNQAVSFEVGGDISLPPTLPRDCDSQLNFPMDNATPSHSNTPAEVRSKQVYQNQTDSLTKAMTASLQQVNEWTRSNTPLPVTTDKTSVEATDQGGDEACFVGKPHPSKPVPIANASLPTSTVPEVKREVNANSPAPPASLPPTADGAAVHHVATSIEYSNTHMERTWHSKPEIFALNREKMAIMISKQKTSRYHKRFNTTIPVSKSKKGVQLTLEIFPFGRDADIETHHMTVLAQVSYPLSSRKCQEMAENCNCIVEVKTTFFNFKTRERLSSREGKAELSPTSCEACVQISQALSHSDILYSKTNKIQMEVEATLRCQDKVIAAPSDDPDCPDYLVVSTL